MIAAPVHSEPIILSVLTRRTGKAAVYSKLHATKIEACGDYGQPLKSCVVHYRVGKCHPVGKTIVCSFRMQMRSGVTCRGRVQVRKNAAVTEGRYLGPTKHPENVVCS